VTGASLGPPAERPAATRRAVAAWADWYARMGVLDSVGEPGAGRSPPLPSPPDRAPLGSPPPSEVPSRRAAVPARDPERVAHASEVAASCRSLGELEAALARFEGCPLKETATRLCFADGDSRARLMLIGEAPGAEEDRLGKPFVGPSGQLLDRMLAAVGLDRGSVWITNVIFWRPPGNRSPTTLEVSVCQPFLERQVELLEPRLILFLGGSAARALLDVTDGVTKLRGRRFGYQPGGGAGGPIPAFVTFHPAYLLRQPLQKRLAWRDMLAVRRELDACAGGRDS
jgi:uracil-DNA glycosylase family 4